MEAELVREGLRQGDRLGWYRIERVLGRGGFGITYLATDTNLQTRFAVKEYLPDQLARRNPDNSLCPSTPEAGKTYAWGLQRFVSEARTLARFRHPNIVRVFSVFETKGTAYMVMEYEHGQDLKRYLKTHPSARSEEALKGLFLPVLDGLRLIHGSGFIHRDIKPANIIVRPDGSPVLIDFGSARKSYGRGTRTLTSLVSVGYAPLEQYSDAGDDNKQGPWTDIYACGAVLYYAIGGNAPVDATQRGTAVLNATPDPLRPLADIAGGEYSREFLEAIDWALCFAIADRPADLDEWSPRLLGRPLPGAAERSRPPLPPHGSGDVLPRSAAPVDDPGDAAAPRARAEPAGRPPRGELPDPEDWALPSATAASADVARGDAAGGRRRPRRGALAATVVAVAAVPLITYVLLEPSAVSRTPPEAATAGSSALPQTRRAEGGTLREDAAGAALADATRSVAAGTDTATQGLPGSLTGRLQALRAAVAGADLEAVGELCELSDRTRLALGILFRHFDAIDVDLKVLGSPSNGGDDVAELSIRSLRRATGTTAVPAGAFRSLTVRARTSDDGTLRMML